MYPIGIVKEKSLLLNDLYWNNIVVEYKLWDNNEVCIENKIWIKYFGIGG